MTSQISAPRVTKITLDNVRRSGMLQSFKEQIKCVLSATRQPTNIKPSLVPRGFKKGSRIVPDSRLHWTIKNKK